MLAFCVFCVFQESVSKLKVRAWHLVMLSACVHPAWPYGPPLQCNILGQHVLA